MQSFFVLILVKNLLNKLPIFSKLVIIYRNVWLKIYLLFAIIIYYYISWLR